VLFNESERRRSPAVESLTVHPEPAPRFEGCEGRAADVTVIPAGVQVPVGVVQARKSADFIAVVVGTVKTNVYVVTALGAELPIVT
jgi:hypothetical protein